MDRLEEIEERFADAMGDMPFNAKLGRKLHLAEIDVPWLIAEILALRQKLKEVMKYYCPKCGKELERTETDGLWCSNNCYESEFHLWEALQEREKKNKRL